MALTIIGIIAFIASLVIVIGGYIRHVIYLSKDKRYAVLHDDSLEEYFFRHDDYKSAKEHYDALVGLGSSDDFPANTELVEYIILNSKEH